MRRRSLVLAWNVVVALVAALGRAEEVSSLEVPPLAGAAWSGDSVTLIVSAPASGKLLYVDTSTGKVAKEVEVDFKPDQLAIQGSNLFASVQGSPTVHVLDATTGKSKSQIVLTGEAIRTLACHPKQGPLFASTLTEEVWQLDPAKAKGTKTKAQGMFLAIDPVGGKTLYTGTNRPSQEFVEVTKAGKATRIRLVTVKERASILKYQIGGTGLKLVGGNTNAAFGAGGYLCVSPDGKKVALAAGGGWRSLTDRMARYVIPVFDTKDTETLLGQVETEPYPQSIAFHPVLNLGAAARTDGLLKVFKATAFTEKQTFQCGQGPGGRDGVLLLGFGAKGTRLVFYKEKQLYFANLQLASEEIAQLTKAYGKLPDLAKSDGDVEPPEGDTPMPKGKKPSTKETAKAPAGKPAAKTATAQAKGKTGVKGLVTINQDAHDNLADVAKQDISYLEDRDEAKITKLPKELDGAMLLVRPSNEKMFWLTYPSWYTVNRPCTVYVALLMEEDGFRRVGRADREKILEEGWEAKDWEFSVTSDRKQTWTVYSRKVKAGPLDIKTRISISGGEAIFFFK